MHLQDLRLHVHAVMEKKPEIVPVAPDPCIIALLRLRPLCLAPSAIIDLKDQIERRLSSTFYNLTALSPHLAEAVGCDGPSCVVGGYVTQPQPEQQVDAA